MTAILVVERCSPPPRRRRALRALEPSTATPSQNHLISDLLDGSRIISGSPLDLRTVDLPRVAEAAVERPAPGEGKASASHVAHPHAGRSRRRRPPATGVGNLLTNAISSPPRAVRYLSLRVVGTRVEVTVRDTGIGSAGFCRTSSTASGRPPGPTASTAAWLGSPRPQLSAALAPSGRSGGEGKGRLYRQLPFVALEEWKLATQPAATSSRCECRPPSGLRVLSLTTSRPPTCCGRVGALPRQSHPPFVVRALSYRPLRPIFNHRRGDARDDGTSYHQGRPCPPSAAALPRRPLPPTSWRDRVRVPVRLPLHVPNPVPGLVTVGRPSPPLVANAAARPLPLPCRGA